MNFEHMEDQLLPEKIVGQIIDQLTDAENPASGGLSSRTLVTDAAEPLNNGDVVKEPTPATSTSKSVVADRKGRTDIQEFIRILRPNLPRKSKSKAYKLLKHIANGMIVEGTFQRRLPPRKKKPKKRTIRKPPMKRTKPKMKSATTIRGGGGGRRSVYSLCDSTDSSISERCASKFNNHNRRMKDSCYCCDYGRY